MPGSENVARRRVRRGASIRLGLILEHMRIIQLLARSATCALIVLICASASDGTQDASGGLGLSQAEWERDHKERGKDLFGVKYDDAYTVIFRKGNVSYIERQWRTSNAVNEAQVVTEIQSLIPGDSELIRTYSPEGRPETTVRLYRSDYLKSRFGSDAWVGGEPGNFIGQYNKYEHGVTRMIISTGNNP